MQKLITAYKFTS